MSLDCVCICGRDVLLLLVSECNIHLLGWLMCSYGLLVWSMIVFVGIYSRLK